MSEWERLKAQPPSTPEEGAAEAAGPESQGGQSAPGAGGSSQRPPASMGVTYELCAGLVDKPDLSLEEIARQEVLEECGYDVPASRLKRITSYRSALLLPLVLVLVWGGRGAWPGGGCRASIRYRRCLSPP